MCDRDWLFDDRARRKRRIRGRLARFAALALASMVLLAVTTFADEPSTDTVRFGLRFVVDDNLAITIPRRQLTSTALAEFVGEVNGYYQSSHVVLRAEIVGMSFARFASDDVMVLLSDMEHERNAFKGMFRCAEDTGADYTIAVSSRLMIRASVAVVAVSR
ncbi:MAG: hypothetical protein KBG29_13220 [Pseudomonadales bacterium]|nr:hypothetical protein [Pseudomonadales bacterium]